MEQDGSGDFTVIQQAVDAAAPGDSILVGEGRFTEHAPFSVPGWTEEVYVAIQTDDLTLIGQGPDLTIIGPDAPNHDPATEAPKAIVGVFISELRVTNITVENTRDGLYRSEGHLFLQNCIFRNCEVGLIGSPENGMNVEYCQFIDNNSSGISTFPPAQDISVRNSHFTNDTANINFNGTVNAYVYDCIVQGGTGGIQFADYSGGGVYDWLVDGAQNASVIVTVVSNAILERNRLLGGGINLSLSTFSHVTGSGNVLSGGSFATIRNSHNTMDFHGNHILNSGGYSILLDAFINPPDVIIDLSNNYWGTTGLTNIRNTLYDYYDDGVTVKVDCDHKEGEYAKFY